MKQLVGNLITIKNWSVVVFGLSYTIVTKVALSYFIIGNKVPPTTYIFYEMARNQTRSC